MDTLKAFIAWVIILVVIIYIAAMVIQATRVHELCLRYGWYESTVTWKLEGYCGREENEYEIVKPLSEIIKEQ